MEILSDIGTEDKTGVGLFANLVYLAQPWDCWRPSDPRQPKHGDTSPVTTNQETINNSLKNVNIPTLVYGISIQKTIITEVFSSNLPSQPALR